jgi:outer membrane protein assembly factor BamB/TolA-binding protein
VLITVYCPSCRSRFQLDPSLRGQSIRCPNHTCREVFEVREADDQPKDAPLALELDAESPIRTDHPGQQQAEADASKRLHHSGNVGDLIPFLDVESVPMAADPRHGQDDGIIPFVPDETASPPEPEPSASQSWLQPPPVRRRPVPPVVEASPAPPEPDPPPRKDSGRHDTPPPGALSRRSKTPKPKPVPEVEAPAPIARAPTASADAPVMLAPSNWEAPPVRRSKDLPDKYPETESHPTEVDTTTPSSPATQGHASRIMAILILVVLGAAGGVTWLVWTQWSSSEANQYARANEEFNQTFYLKAKKSFRDLVTSFPNSPKLQEYQFMADLSEGLQLAQDVSADPKDALNELDRFLQDHAGDTQVQPHRKVIRETLDKIGAELVTLANQKLRPPISLDQARQRLREARQAHDRSAPFGDGANAETEQQLRALEESIVRTERVQDLLAQLHKLTPTPAGIRSAELLARQLNLEGEPEVRQVLAAMRGVLRAGVLAEFSYTPAAKALAGPVEANPERGLVVVSRVKGSEADKVVGDGVVFALARGMLYALAQKDGELRWATRVGIDTTTLPVRLPAGETTPEIALVLSSDTNVLTARDVRTGRVRWHHALEWPCLGRPALIGQRAYVPTYDGRVHEIEVVDGQLVGWYKVGQPLTVGCTHQEGTDLLYVPADSLFVYVFDVKQHQCVGLLESDHPSGSLRSPPLLVSTASSDPNAADAGRPNYLILNQTDGLGAMKLRAFPLPIARDVPTPALEPELSVPGWSWFEPHCDGERIALATDANHFGLIGINQPRNRDTHLFPLVAEDKAVPPAESGRHVGRAQVIHAEANDFWVLMDGHLQQLHLAIDRQKGLQLTKRWPRPFALGSPLHASQVSDSRDVLFVVSQMTGSHDCLASAIDNDTGQIRWQRRLGMVCQADPVVVGGQVLAVDRNGDPYQFDPNQMLDRLEEWQPLGQLLPPVMNETKGAQTLVLPAPDGQAVYALTSVPKGIGMSLTVRRVGDGTVVSKTYTFAEPLAGTPAVGPDFLLLPLADGNLVWQPLRDPDKRREKGYPAHKEGRSHAVYLNPEEFLLTDGNRHLGRWRWPKEHEAKEVKHFDFPDRIVAAPVLVSPDLVCVATTGARVWLLDAGDLREVRVQQLDGREITAGPFVMGDRIGCVVDHRHLACIDSSGAIVWTYQTPGEGIVGQPHLAGDVLVVADRAGQLVGLDPATGKQRGSMYTLKGSVSPAAAPVAFGADRLFVPLTDGSILLLPLSDFK